MFCSQTDKKMIFTHPTLEGRCTAPLGFISVKFELKTPYAMPDYRCKIHDHSSILTTLELLRLLSNF